MIPGINPKQMQAMMKKMGISQNQINAKRVIFETNDGNLVINNPDVLKIMMNGQESYQVNGHAEFESESESKNEDNFSEEDIEMVMGQTGKDESAVIDTLRECDGDIAEAIMKLK